MLNSACSLTHSGKELKELMKKLSGDKDSADEEEAEEEEEKMETENKGPTEGNMSNGIVVVLFCGMGHHVTYPSIAFSQCTLIPRPISSGRVW